MHILAKKKPSNPISNPDDKTFIISNDKIKKYGYKPRSILSPIDKFVKDNL